MADARYKFSFHFLSYSFEKKKEKITFVSGKFVQLLYPRLVNYHYHQSIFDLLLREATALRTKNKFIHRLLSQVEEEKWH